MRLNRKMTNNNEDDDDWDGFNPNEEMFQLERREAGCNEFGDEPQEWQEGGIKSNK
jgi:hypothetical protein